MKILEYFFLMLFFFLYPMFLFSHNKSLTSESTKVKRGHVTALKTKEWVEKELRVMPGAPKNLSLRAIVCAKFSIRIIENKNIDYVINRWLFLYKGDNNLISASGSRNFYDLRIKVAPIGTFIKINVAKIDTWDEEKFGYLFIVMHDIANDIDGSERNIIEYFDSLGRMRQQDKYPNVYSKDYTSNLINFSSDFISLPEIKNFNVDIDEAISIAIKNGGFPTAPGGLFGGGIILLSMRNIDGTFAPIWLLPLHNKDHLIWGVRADTGKIVYIKTDLERSDKWTTTKKSRNR